ncbi:MAG: ribonuclease HII [Verrucomicrobiota bacterium]|jgi:ribonuclease HII|nr:ribonuclease HII [Verrucomicrobiota bacterium]
MDLLHYERQYWAAAPGNLLAGVDEAGRGCLAGPVVAGAVALPPELAETLYAGPLAGLTDSKQLTAAARDTFFGVLTGTPGVGFATGWCTAQEIDRLNILVATHLAMRRALEALPRAAAHALVDGLPVKGLPCPSDAIVKGDAKSFLVAAASVVAKVSRDRHMAELDAQYPQYGFAANKGYGVHAHIAALYKHGACPEHRRTFRPVQDVEQRLPGFAFV